MSNNILLSSFKERIVELESKNIETVSLDELLEEVKKRFFRLENDLENAYYNSMGEDI